MNQPPTLPPVSPPSTSSQGKNSKSCVLLGCAALFLLLLGVGLVVAAGFWFYGRRAVELEGQGGDTSQAADLGFGAKLSQYELSGGSASVIGPDGAWHVVFQEMPAYGKPVFIYHRFSTDGGKTWSVAENISNDNTGNGAGFPRLGCDAQGALYAAWVRFGVGGRAVTESTLDGPGGYQPGTLTLRRCSGGAWSPPFTFGTPEKVASFCMFTGANGVPHLLWVDEGSAVMEAAAQNGSPTVVAPAGAIAVDNPLIRPNNLSAMVDPRGAVLFTGERKFQNAQQLFFWAGGQVQVLAAEPKYETRNTFNHPAQIFEDSHSTLHVIYVPNPKLTEHQEVWDMDPATGKHQVIFSGRDGEETVQSFQVAARDGRAHVILEWSAKPAIVADSTELVEVSFDGASWSPARGLTGNARAEKFFFKDLHRGNDVAVSTRYHAKHASAAMDAMGNVSLVGTISAYSVFGSGSLERYSGTTYKVTTVGSVAHPSLYVVQWRK